MKGGSVRRVWTVVVADLRQLLRQKMAPLLMVAMVLGGMGLAVGAARFDPAIVIPLPRLEGDEAQPDSAPVVCDGRARIAVTGALPTYLHALGVSVDEDDATAVLGMQWVPGEDDDGELLYWKGPVGTEAHVKHFETCARMAILDEKFRRHMALGITHSRGEVLRVRRHGPESKPDPWWTPRIRWLRPSLPVGLDLFEVLVALFAVVMGSGQVVDGILRNRMSGWEETLGTVGLSGRERVMARVLSAWTLIAVLFGLFATGGLLAAPVVGLVVSPASLLVSLLTPFGVSLVLVMVTRPAVDVRSATARLVLPLAGILYLMLGGVVLDLVWLPLGGPLCLAVFGGTASDWIMGTLCTLVPMALVLALGIRRVPDVRTNHGERQSAAARHALGRFGPEAGLVSALAFWAIVVLPLAASDSIVLAHLLGQVVGLGGVALLAPVALGLPVRETLGLHQSPVRSWLAGTLMPLGTVPLMLLLMKVQVDAELLDAKQLGLLDELARTYIEPLAEPLGGALIWAVPGTMEELILRGAVLGLLLPRGSWKRTHVRTAWAVLVQAVVFGGLHLVSARL